MSQTQREEALCVARVKETTTDTDSQLAPLLIKDLFTMSNILAIVTHIISVVRRL